MSKLIQKSCSITDHSYALSKCKLYFKKNLISLHQCHSPLHGDDILVMSDSRSDYLLLRVDNLDHNYTIKEDDTMDDVGYDFNNMCHDISNPECDDDFDQVINDPRVIIDGHVIDDHSHMINDVHLHGNEMVINDEDIVIDGHFNYSNDLDNTVNDGNSHIIYDCVIDVDNNDEQIIDNMIMKIHAIDDHNSVVDSHINDDHISHKIHAKNDHLKDHGDAENRVSGKQIHAKKDDSYNRDDHSQDITIQFIEDIDIDVHVSDHFDINECNHVDVDLDDFALYVLDELSQEEAMPIISSINTFVERPGF